MTHFHARPHEVTTMLAGEQFCIVRPLKNQPDEPKERVFILNEKGTRTFDLHSGARFVRGKFVGSERLQIIQADYAPGDMVDVLREVRIRGGAIYDAAGGIIDSFDDEFVWESANLTLSVSDVQVKRVQDITEEEARLAGSQAPGDTLPLGARKAAWSERQAFANIWNQHHPKTPWDANPWCVVARSQVHHCNIKDMKGEAA